MINPLEISKKTSSNLDLLVEQCKLRNKEEGLGKKKTSILSNYIKRNKLDDAQAQKLKSQNDSKSIHSK